MSTTTTTTTTTNAEVYAPMTAELAERIIIAEMIDDDTDGLRDRYVEAAKFVSDLPEGSFYIDMHYTAVHYRADHIHSHSWGSVDKSTK